MAAIDSNRVWEGYGFAMGSALKLELLMRVANLGERGQRIKRKHGESPTAALLIARVGATAMRGTFGTVCSAFRTYFAGRLEEAELKLFDLALLMRNDLAHHFLART